MMFTVVLQLMYEKTSYLPFLKFEVISIFQIQCIPCFRNKGHFLN